MTGSPGSNPHGLQSLQIWQTDVTHYPEFVSSTFTHPLTPFQVHYSHHATQMKMLKMFASIFLPAFATLGVPQQIKTDNGPAYTSQ